MPAHRADNPFHLCHYSSGRPMRGSAVACADAAGRNSQVTQTNADEWQMTAQGAQVYDDVLVPAIFAPWVSKVLNAAQLRLGHSVLDVACGTGILAHAAAGKVGPAGSVVGLDINSDMLAIAARRRGDSVQWTEGDAQCLPYPDAHFDRVLCQLGLQYFADQFGAVQEMHRVTRPDGRVTIMLWRDISHSPGFALLADLLGDQLGPEVRESMHGPFSFGDNEWQLREWLEKAGFSSVSIYTVSDMVHFRSVQEFVGHQLEASPLGGNDELATRPWTESVTNCMMTEFGLTDALDPIKFPIEAYLAVGLRPAG
jgi:SAM-dependent methyltransferase